MTSTMRACPYCGDTPVIEAFDTAAGGMGEEWFEVECQSCHAFGGASKKAESAVEAWNKVATPLAPKWAYKNP
jgi:Lar family restriction alleviation protein